MITVKKDEVLLEPDPISVSHARHFVERLLDNTPVPEDSVYTATLLTSELVTNSLIHAQTSFKILLELTDESLKIAIQDKNYALPNVKKYSTTASTGRGLGLVESLASTWGVDIIPEGKSIWFTVNLLDQENKGTKHLSFEEDLPPLELGNIEKLTLVTLCKVPLYLLADTSIHYEGLVREFVIMQTSQTEDLPKILPVLLAALEEFNKHFKGFTDNLEAALLKKNSARQEMDLNYRVPPNSDAILDLNSALDQADDLCVDLTTLLTPPPTYDIRMFRDWMLTEVAKQLNEQPMQSWPDFIAKHKALDKN